jgi:hypothetical protein
MWRGIRSIALLTVLGLIAALAVPVSGQLAARDESSGSGHLEIPWDLMRHALALGRRVRQP